jgi:ferredoxin-nitrite reductase
MQLSLLFDLRPWLSTSSSPLIVMSTGLQLVPFSEALMLVFRDYGARGDRQKTRLMWLVEELGNEKFTSLVSEYMGGAEFGTHVDPQYTDVWKRRDIIGVHPQKQEGLSWVCAMAPQPRAWALFARVQAMPWWTARC